MQRGNCSQSFRSPHGYARFSRGLRLEAEALRPTCSLYAKVSLASLLVYNLGNLWRRLVLPKEIGAWSLTILKQRLVKTGGGGRSSMVAILGSSDGQKRAVGTPRPRWACSGGKFVVSRAGGAHDARD